MTTDEGTEMAEPDFEALRAERNRRVLESLRSIADKYGFSFESMAANYNADDCYCACGFGGPCEHRWDGDGLEFDNGWTATCSRCGSTAMSHSMRVGP